MLNQAGAGGKRNRHAFILIPAGTDTKESSPVNSEKVGRCYSHILNILGSWIMFCISVNLLLTN